MNCLKFTLLLGVLLLLLSIDTAVEAKKRRKSSSGNKTKTKTKWSTSTELGAGGVSPVVASEEHGYYVKRTYLPTNASGGSGNSDGEIVMLPARQTPPFLAIPIAWFACADKSACQQGNTIALNSELQALSAGFLCDDDCFEPYEPICGKTNFEVAVFYNKCKLNVAKCRTHGLWQDYTYEECQTMYPKEVAYAEQKFRASPYFKEAEKPLAAEVEKEAIVNIALEALSEIDYKLAEAEAEQKMEQTTTSTSALLLKQKSEMTPKEQENKKGKEKATKKENETGKLVTI